MFTEAVAQGFSVKKVFLEVSQNSQGNICARISFLIKLQVSARINIPSAKLTPIAYINHELFSFISSLLHQLQKFN